MDDWYSENCGNGDNIKNITTLTSMDSEIILSAFYILSSIITIEIISSRISHSKNKKKKDTINGIYICANFNRIILLQIRFYSKRRGIK